MRLVLILLLSLASFHAQDANITRYLYVTTSTSCPGNNLTMNATASDGLPAAGVELRLVLYLPYQGLRALQHTDASGLASVELTKNGSYRLYINTDKYDHPQYVEFEYPELCPPPPPGKMDISVVPDCDAGLLRISATGNGTPLEGVFIRTDKWSSLSGADGSVSFPLDEGDVPISANKTNYTGVSFYYTVSCAPPPECVDDSACREDQYCSGGSCIDLAGDCGFASNHTWFAYRCCEDADCGNLSTCENNACVPKPPPPQNKTGMINATGPPPSNDSNSPQPSSPVCPGSALLVLISACLFHKR
jgi:hypothetical protein